MSDPPAKLPVDHLSVSSIELLEKCPQKWYLRYVAKQYEPPTGKMVLGSSVWAAEAQHYGHVIESGEGFSLEQVQDEFSAEWDLRAEEGEILYESEKPGKLKDHGLWVVERYHTLVAPQVVPTAVEREFRLRWQGLDWDFIGYIDLEVAGNRVSDMKVKKQTMYQPTADKELQPASYLDARRREGNPADGFDYHICVRGNKPRAYILHTNRTDAQLDTFEHRVFTAATEIAWRAENDEWGPAPVGAWWCSDARTGGYCGYFGTLCPWTRT